MKATTKVSLLIVLGFACFSNAEFTRCEIKLNGLPILESSEIPAECLSLSDEDRESWIEENNKLDEFFQVLDEVEEIIAPAGNETLKETLKLFKFKMYDDLEVFDKMSICQDEDSIFDHCNCVNVLRDQMITWLRDDTNILEFRPA